jgi:hypothetical protein
MRGKAVALRFRRILGVVVVRLWAMASKLMD